ncbi:metallophosphoesterase [Methylobacillus caricis]|uniref:metallophosphoesterase n=1 Tax=Methylobacillus caricis TaxID=1971611 RepID=UPI001CFF9A59|nr:metallophosphoesterase [Methylobacillus caricis]MCB5188869.1 metallophosphoesterase [Methylobacillus caricis]
MRLLILSDLHRELWLDSGPQIGTHSSDVDVVILAGDIDSGDKAVKWAQKTFQNTPVIYIAGNHEFYGHCIQDIEAKISSAASATSNVRFLNCSEMLLDGYRFLGATLWTDYELFSVDLKQKAMSMAKDILADYRYIKRSSLTKEFITPEDTIVLHQRHVQWLEERLLQPFDGKTIVVTHMGPSIKSITKTYINDPVSAGFASDLEFLVKQADLWVHGHIHESVDYMIQGCRVLTNPCGYRTRGGAPENWEFDPNLVVIV